MIIKSENIITELNNKSVALSFETTDKAVLELGINKVNIAYIDGQWTIEANQNIKVILKPNS